MKHYLPLTLGAVLVIVSGGTTAAQDAPKTPAPTVELTGCVSVSPSATGQFAFVDGASGGTYRLSGKGIKKYAGQKVTIVGDPNSKRVRFRTGLWPSPNVAAQAGAIDPAKAAVARMPGGAADAPGANPLPEFHVTRLHGVEGACQ